MHLKFGHLDMLRQKSFVLGQKTSMFITQKLENRCEKQIEGVPFSLLLR